MRSRKILGLALIMVSLLTLAVFFVSRFIQPVLPQDINDSVILVIASFIGVLGVLASFNEIAELISKISNATKNQSNSPYVNSIVSQEALGFITIDTRPLLGAHGKIQLIPYTQFGTVGDLLDAIWLSLDDSVPPFAYEEKWILRDADSGYIYTDIRRKILAGKPLHDDRSLEEVNIRPNMKLEVVAINKGL